MMAAIVATAEASALTTAVTRAAAPTTTTAEAVGTMSTAATAAVATVSYGVFCSAIILFLELSISSNSSDPAATILSS